MKRNTVNSVIAAAGRLSIRIEAVQMAKAAGCTAFKESGRVNVQTLKSFLDAHPEIGETVAKMPDAKLERALKYQAERKLKEAELGQLEGRIIDKEEARRS